MVIWSHNILPDANSLSCSYGGVRKASFCSSSKSLKSPGSRLPISSTRLSDFLPMRSMRFRAGTSNRKVRLWRACYATVFMSTTSNLPLDRSLHRAHANYPWSGASKRAAQLPARYVANVPRVEALLRHVRAVWGPEPFRLGFIGAPIATAISFNLISILSIIYGLFFVPKTAWHPLSTRCFTSLGVLVQLGLSGVGQVASEWWSWELVGRECSFLSPLGSPRG